MAHVELTKKQLTELEALKALPFKSESQGDCAGCGRRIPFGYVPLVTKYESVDKGGMKFPRPKVMYCRDCEPSVAKGNKHPSDKAKKPIVDDKTNGTPLNKDIAKKIMAVMSKSKAHSPRWLLKRAHLDIDKAVVLTTLKKLYADGVVGFEDGQWILR